MIDVEQMQHALRLIAGTRCERTTGGGWRCVTEQGLTKDAEYLADRWCDACIAHWGLTTPAQMETS